jgi:abhydrolase domain-containing protein 6
MTTQYFPFGDKSLAYKEQGSGPPVVIVHGVGGHKEDWTGVAQALADKYHVIAIDMLGFGESSKTGDDLSMPVQAAALEALFDAKSLEKVSLIGNSVGGWVTATFAATYPKRLDKLVLIDVAGFEAMFEGEPPANFDPNTVEEQRALLRVVAPNAADILGVAEHAFESYVATGEKAIAAVWGQSLYASPRLETLLPKITAPTLVLWGADDTLFPSVLCDVFAGQIADAQSALIAGAGHFPHMDNPDGTIDAVRNFLAGAA